ncbi:hypothetical protein TRS1_60 [Acinetobacter phage vB_AbaS_TRS1]|jgi:hypothetical protein|uniref:hypothetical protein n=1 Tax=Acinetobacter phage vB_AbaS_TRS1 TaxID=1852629 RepID=UPI00080EFEAD|nr:hypothetical protein TRS1_60 [Acinetobacter phage vB_AbaS_TRS1]ANT40772.1 hypothetical protein TRS1_60 [Acinetobacter phage vB_AbaS_TRS1]
MKNYDKFPWFIILVAIALIILIVVHSTYNLRQCNQETSVVKSLIIGCALFKDV